MILVLMRSCWGSRERAREGCLLATEHTKMQIKNGSSATKRQALAANAGAED